MRRARWVIVQKRKRMQKALAREFIVLTAMPT